MATSMLGPSSAPTMHGSPNGPSSTFHGLRSTFPGLSSDDLVQKWIDGLTGASVSDVPDPTGDVIEARAVDTMKRAEVYLDLLKHAEDNNPAENCLDCTFCGAWFPPYWLLDITPEGTADWRNHYYRCCFQCINGDNDDHYTGSPHTPHCHLRSPTDRAPR